MYTVDELFNSRGDARANVRQWLRSVRYMGPPRTNVVPVFVPRLTSVGVAALTMAGGEVADVYIRLPVQTLIELLSAEP